MPDKKRRNFLKKCGFSTLPLLTPILAGSSTRLFEPSLAEPKTTKTPVNFIYDGLIFSPQKYLEKLQQINEIQAIEADFYGNGGTTKALEEEFARLTGKEKAIYLPTGTMANQIAINLLNGGNTKVIVPENSHVYRDEADAAQSVHNKRLVPIGKGKAFFDLEDLKEKISYIKKEEVFSSGLGTVVIENPIRRVDNTMIPISTIKEISTYCRENGYKLHLDGARIHLASAFSGVSIAEYAAYFDTIYISLYKYLNAAGGAILCGDSKIIDQVVHQIKILGGTVFQNWNNTAVALHYLNGIETRWEKVIQLTNELILELNKIEGIKITKLTNGTNTYHLELAKEISLKTLVSYLYQEHNIWLGRANEAGIVKWTVNESLLTRNLQEIVDAWVEGVEKAKI